MINDYYYFGNYTPNGWASIINKNCYNDFKKISICGYPNCAKQQAIKRIKSILCRRKTPYIDLKIADGSMGILCEKLKLVIVDGELVNIENSEIINVYDYIPKNTLSELEDIIHKLEIERKRSEMRCERFLSACKSVNDDMRRIDSKSVDFSKLNRFSSRMWKKNGGKPNGRVGTQEKRFVTSLTKDGVELNMTAFDKLCKNIAVVYDKTGACSAPVVERIRSYAISGGYHVISCICPVNLEIEHIIIPELEYGVFTSKHYHRADFKNCDKIYASKFHTFNSPSTIQRLDFTFKVYKSLMNEVFECIAKIKETDERMNNLLISHTDVSLLFNDLTNLVSHLR